MPEPISLVTLEENLSREFKMDELLVARLLLYSQGLKEVCSRFTIEVGYARAMRDRHQPEFVSRFNCEVNQATLAEITLQQQNEALAEELATRLGVSSARYAQVKK